MNMTKKHTWKRPHLTDGLCWNCGKHPKVNATECEECRRKRRIRHRLTYDKKAQQRKKNRRHNFKLRGMCSYCGTRRPVIGLLSCSVCLSKRNRYVRDKKDKVFRAYGGYKCVCCGETIPQFLTLDHINNDGAAHRKNIFGNKYQSCGTGAVLYNWVIRNNFPDIFQVLCYNCNCGKAHNGGICPHKTIKSLAG